MNKNQSVVIEWLTETENDLVDNITELGRYFDNVPSNVCDAYQSLSGREFLESILFSVDQSIGMKHCKTMVQ